MMDSIQAVRNAVPASPASPDVWMYVAGVEFVLLVFVCVRLLLLRGRCRPEREKVKERILREGDVDFSNVIDSSFKAKALYDGLKKVCHPDRFAGDGRLAAKATEIFGLLVRHKHDYAALRGLKERAECELGVKIEEE